MTWAVYLFSGASDIVNAWERRHPCRRVAFSMLRGVKKVRADKDAGALSGRSR